MNKEDIKREYCLELRKRFDYVEEPYEDISSYAINDFIAEYIVKKLSLYGVRCSMNGLKITEQ